MPIEKHDCAFVGTFATNPPELIEIHNHRSVSTNKDGRIEFQAPAEIPIDLDSSMLGIER